MKKQIGEDERLPTLAELLASSVNNKQLRRILEFCYPLTLYVEIDEQGVYHIIGVPGVPGHFQSGTLFMQTEWTPAFDQQVFLWQTKQEQQGYLHYVSRQQTNSTGVVALVQHQPTYVRRGKNLVLQDINIALVTPLWGDVHLPVGKNERNEQIFYQALDNYRCTLKAPCTCNIYQALLETHAYQRGL